jgi:hypothetical protein
MLQAKSWKEKQEGQRAQKCVDFSACFNKLKDLAKLTVPTKFEHWSNAAELKLSSTNKEGLRQILRSGFEGVNSIDPSGECLVYMNFLLLLLHYSPCAGTDVQKPAQLWTMPLKLYGRSKYWITANMTSFSRICFPSPRN